MADVASIGASASLPVSPPPQAASSGGGAASTSNEAAAAATTSSGGGTYTAIATVSASNIRGVGVNQTV